MSEEEINKLKIRLQLAEDNNKILNQRLKERDKDLKILNNLYQKEKKKINTIYSAITTQIINEQNYMKAINWIIKTIEEEIK